MTGTRSRIGPPVDRVDGPLKVKGEAKYPIDVTLPNMAHAALVQSTIAFGTIRRIDIARARAAPGVLTILTHENRPPLAPGPMTPFGPSNPLPLRSDRILAYGQDVAVIVAETREQAVAAARLVSVTYEPDEPVLGIENSAAPVVNNPAGLESQRGDVDAALASAEITIDARYRIAAETNNPIGLFATVAEWSGDRLVVHDSTQWPTLVRQTLATIFGVPEDHVRVLVPFLGGAFGAGLRVWSHVVLAVLAARIAGRPVKLALTRPQMFTSIGYRAETLQRVRLGASRDGRLVAIDHDATTVLGAEGMNASPIVAMTRTVYACPNVATHDRQVRLHVPCPSWMRGPGTVEANFAIESAMDELATALRIDPIELRLRNYAEAHPTTGLPWSSKALRECYSVGAARFGWSKRNPAIGSMRDGDSLIGYGMAGVEYEWYQAPSTASLTVRRDGSAVVRGAATDIGTGTYTIASQLVSELLGIETKRVKVEIGDSDLPPTPQSGGSGLANAFGSAIHDAAQKLLQEILTLASNDAGSPLRGRSLDRVTTSNGRVHVHDDIALGESYTDILARHGLDELTAMGRSAPRTEGLSVAPTGAFGAQFAEVHVDKDLGTVRVARLVSAIDGGRILNEKTARSQIIGGAVMGIGMALLEATVFDPASGRITNGTFGDYLIPAHADVPNIDVLFVGQPDTLSPIGVKGVGEVGLVGVAAAIANAVFHATGRRMRSLPIAIEDML